MKLLSQINNLYHRSINVVHDNFSSGIRNFYERSAIAQHEKDIFITYASEK